MASDAPEAPVTVQDEIPVRDHPLGAIATKEKLPKLFCRDCNVPLADTFVEVTVSKPNPGFPFAVEQIQYQLCLDHGAPLIIQSIWPDAA